MTQNRRPRGLFLNPNQAQCSIYESGLMVYQALILSDRYELDYVEIDENHRKIGNQYDFYLFNYHNVTTSWIDTKKIALLPGIKMTMVLEVLPNNPYVLCPPDDFDVYLAIDPTMKVEDKNVYGFPRPLENSFVNNTFVEPVVPKIGTFGFATQGKGFERVVEAVNKEFEKAEIRINMPSGTYSDQSTWNIHKRNYAEMLGNSCKKLAKKGIEIKVTHDYLTKEALIKWCSENTLNCFLYDRNLPGLSATTDQAISSGRPLAVSENETFRHIHAYLAPYPKQSLIASIQNSRSAVLEMQKDWHPMNFASKFEGVLKDFNLLSAGEPIQNPKHIKIPSRRRSITKLTAQIARKIKTKLFPVAK